MPRTTIRLGAVLFASLAAVSVASACSSSRSADTSSPDTSTTAAASASGAASFGTLASPCGKGAAKGSPDKGVTDTDIAIGYGDDRGFVQSPGLNKEIGDAVTGMIKWCNDQGGINGRTIKGTNYDAALTKVNTVMQQACKTDFMLVGEGFAGDDGAEATRVGCGLPAVPAFAVGPNFANGPMMFQAVPNPDDVQPAAVYSQLLALKPDTKSSFAYQGSNLPAAVSSIAKSKPAAEGAGFTTVDCGVTINYAGEPNYVPFAQKFKDCGAKIIYLSTTPSPPVFGLLTAMDQVGAHPTYMMQGNGYSAEFAKWNVSGLADNVYVPSAFQPFENASTVPAVQKYLDVIKTVDGKPSLLGMQATSSFLLWATAAKDCGADLTRQCVINKLSKQHEWTGGGLSATTDPGANLPTKCGLLLKMTKSTWSQVYPAKAGEFDCKDSYRFKLPESTWGAKLNSDRIATQFLTPEVIKPQA